MVNYAFAILYIFTAISCDTWPELPNSISPDASANTTFSAILVVQCSENYQTQLSQTNVAYECNTDGIWSPYQWIETEEPQCRSKSSYIT